LSLFFIGLPFALGFDQNLVGVYLFVGILVLGILALFLLFQFREKVIDWVDGLSFLGEKFKGRLQRLITSVFSGFEAISDPAKFLRIFLGMAGAWGLSYIFQYLLFLVFFPGAGTACP
jgi:hypothetical protein